MSIEIRRGNKVDLPASAPDGQPLFVEDTQEVYMGTGAAVVPIKIDSSNVIGGGQIIVTLTCGENINAFQAMVVHSDGLAYKADDATAADANRIVGVAITSATTGNPVNAQQTVVVNVGFLFTAGATVYLGSAGALVQTHSTGLFELPLGVALSASQLEIQIGTPIFYA